TWIRISEAQGDGLVVDVEGKEHGDTRSIRPGVRLQRLAGADGVHDRAHRVHGPSPARLHVRQRGLRLADQHRRYEKKDETLHDSPMTRGEREYAPNRTSAEGLVILGVQRNAHRE